jgi:signal transduction histidine kinase
MDGTDRDVLGAALALLAHDLRNPLAVLHSNMGFLGSVLDPGDRDARDAVDDGLMSCDGLSHVIENIELLAYTLRVPERIPRASVMVSELLGDVALRCEPFAKSYGRTIEVSQEPGQDWEVATHRDLLAKALGNLVRNGVTHAAAATKVVLSARKQGNDVEIWVEDQGHPIPKASRDQAFTLAGQVSAKSMSDGRYSRGMGLFCARVAAELVGARVEIAEPADGKGNSFILRVPAATS